ncbi:MAG: Hyalin [Parcubacteria group bacterium GW2011_GWA2_37_10]|nr:MAG: Hyalin [Parcubacteria group bacterium GW2011_GWA2_37_10]
MKNNKIKIIALFSAVFFLTTASVAFADDPIPPDITPPVITVLGDGSVSVTQNSAYIDTGATAADDIDGDITAQILTVNPVNVSIPGTYTVTYNVSDIAGNTAVQVARAVTVTPLTATVHLTVVTDTQVLYDSDETVSSCESSPNSGIFTVYNMYMYWGWFGDLTYGETSLNAHTVTQGEHLLLNYNINPLKLTVSNSSPAQHDTVTFTLLQFGLDSNFNPVWIPATGGSVAINGISQTVGDDGTYSATVDSTDPYIISGNKTGFINSDTITLNPTAVTVNETVLILPTVFLAFFTQSAKQTLSSPFLIYNITFRLIHYI